MNWRTGAAVAAAGMVGVLGWGSASEGGGEVLAAQTPRGFEFFVGGSRLGVAVRDVEAGDQAQAGGVLVEEVNAGSPAEQAGLRKGDVVVEFDGERVRSVRQFTRLVQETAHARPTPLAVLRDGQRTTLTVTPRDSDRADFGSLDELAGRMGDLRFRMTPRSPAAPPPPPPPPLLDDWRLRDLPRGGGRLGVTLSPVSPQLAKYFGTEHGVLVSSVEEGSVASKVGLRAGDVITAVNGAPVRTPADLRRSIAALAQGEKLSLAVTRDRKSLTLEGTLDTPARRRVSTARV